MSQPFVYRMPVRFADVDHAGIVYYPIFFHYFHQTFEEFFRHQMGADAYVKLLDEDRVGFPAVASSCEYVAPLKFGDDVEVEMSATKLGGKSATFRYRAFRVRPRKGGGDTEERALAAVGTVTCAIVDLEHFRAVPLPERLAAVFGDIADPA